MKPRHSLAAGFVTAILLSGAPRLMVDPQVNTLWRMSIMNACSCLIVWAVCAAPYFLKNTPKD